jgi:hypothetical protein
MSDIVRRVGTLFYASAGNVRAVLGDMAGGLQRLGTQGSRNLDNLNRRGSALNNQLRAIGTTARYALAGSMVFSISRSVQAWGQFQARLGEISAIATGGTGLPIVGRELDDLGNRLLRLSIDTGQPIDDLQAGIVSLYSTVGNVPPNEAAQMMDVIARTAMTSQSTIEDTTNALLGMLNAFKANRSELPKFGAEFYKVIQQSAGMPGHIFAQQLGRLSASASLGGFSPEQMNALSIAATRSGGSPAVNMRGLAQLMTFIMNPSSKQSEKAFGEIGLGPEMRQRLGGWGTLMRVLQMTQQRGISAKGGGPVRAFTEDMLGQITESFGDQPTTSQEGLSGPGAQLLARLFTRVEGRRIAAVLSQLLTPEQVAGTTNKTILQYLDQVTNRLKDAQVAQKNVLDRTQWVRGQAAVHSMGIAITDAFSPLLNLAARGKIDLAKMFVGHQNVTRGIAAALGLGLLTRRGRSLLAGRALPGFGVASAVESEIEGSKVRGETYTRPLYVWVVNQGFGFGGGGGRNVPVPGGGVPPGERIPPGGRVPVPAGRFGRVGRALGVGMGAQVIMGRALGALLIADLLTGGKGTNFLMGHAGEDWNKIRHRRAGGLFGTGIFGPGSGIGMVLHGLFGKPAPSAQQRAEEDVRKRLERTNLPDPVKGFFRRQAAAGLPIPPGLLESLSPKQIQRIMEQAGAMTDVRKAQRTTTGQRDKPVPIEGRAQLQVDVNVHREDDQGKKTTKRTRTHTYIELFPQFTTKPPKTKGQSKSARHSGNR